MKLSARPKQYWYAIIGLFFIFATMFINLQIFFYNSYTIDLFIFYIV